MATADELLRGSIAQPDPEGHIVVGGDRFITVPSNLKRLGVQYDHNMETVVFDCPRYWDNRDMSKMAVYINYALSDGYMDRYPADNVRADGDIMHFEWTISRNVTQVTGEVSFLVCVMDTDSEGNEARHWNSELCQACYISPGMETEESPVDMYPDLITQLLLRMNSVEQINVQAGEMQALYDATVEVANTAEEVKNEALDASDHIKNSYANAIKHNTSGEIIRVDDVSPIQHAVNCRIHGKNLANPNNVIRSLSVDLSYTEPELHIIKTNTTEKWSNIYIGVGVYKDFVGKSLTVSLDNEGNYVWSVLLAGTNSKGELVKEVGGTSATNGHTIFAVTVPEMQDAELLAIRIVSGDNKITTGEEYILKNIQVEEGAVATPYEPYIDPSTVTITRCKKNIIPYPFTDTTVTRKGVTFTDNKDGTITLNGTAEATTSFTIFNGELPVNGQYTLSGLTGGGGSTYYIQPVCSDKAHRGLTDGANTYNWHGITLNRLQLSVVEGTTFSNLRIKPLLELGETATGFEKYEGATSTTASDGTCTVTSKSPTMTLFTDTPGVTIDIEYNVDTEKFLEANLTAERIQTAVNRYLTENPVSGETLIDNATKKSYRLSVVNGKLTLIELEV